MLVVFVNKQPPLVVATLAPCLRVGEPSHSCSESVKIARVFQWCQFCVYSDRAMSFSQSRCVLRGDSFIQDPVASHVFYNIQSVITSYVLTYLVEEKTWCGQTQKKIIWTSNLVMSQIKAYMILWLKWCSITGAN